MSKRGDAKRAKKRGRKAAPRPDREKIPPRIKRAVRQRCGFGCVMCGAPVYHYEHMEDWAKVLKHEEENITLLCPNSHQDKTNHRLSVAKVRAADANPFNLQAGHSTPRLYHFGSETPTVVLGSSTFTHPGSEFAAVVIDGLPIVGFRFVDGQALLQLKLFDAENNLVLQVVDSELIYSIDIWDIEFVGNVLTVRQQARDILLVIELDVEANAVSIGRGVLHYNGIEIEIWPDILAVLNTRNAFGGGGTYIAPVGLIIGKVPKRLENLTLMVIHAEQRAFDRQEAKKWLAETRKSLSSDIPSEAINLASG